jgi:NTP pyrophosphatase (non-canonical NTP hydrolase)
MMNLNEYQELSKRTMPNKDFRKDNCNYALGLVSESGEVGDIIKKYVFHGHSLDRMELMNELGDVLHYLSGMCSMNHFTLEDVAKGNIDKLKRRYPEGFSEERSVNRND